MQIRRLEEIVGKKLFDRHSRRVVLTGEGERLLGYARRMLQLNEEAVSELCDGEMEGLVRVGAPDDYATRFLPTVLSRFSRLCPSVQVEVRCELSVDLLHILDRNEIDLALITRQPGVSGGSTVRREPLVWASAVGYDVHKTTPLPLALFPPGVCVFRDLALPLLDNANMKWRVAFSSPSVSGLQAAVLGGLAITVLAESTVLPDMQILGPEDGFPPLPEIEIALHRQPGELARPVIRLADFVSETLAVAGAGNNGHNAIRVVAS